MKARRNNGLAYEDITIIIIIITIIIITHDIK